MSPNSEALKTLEDALKELESPKGSILSAVQKLSRAANLLQEKEIEIWCAIQIGDQYYTGPLGNFINALASAKKPRTKEEKDNIAEMKAVAQKIGMTEMHFDSEGMTNKHNEAGGGLAGIGFIEEKYADLVRTKRGNDNTYYKSHLYSHITYVRSKAHRLITPLVHRLKFSGTIRSCFDQLKVAVDDKLLDLDPALAEQLMLAFKGVSASNAEEWSQALTTCRRLLEGLADHLYPPTSDTNKGRPLGQIHYINRLWAFMDRSIESSSNKEMAKAHIDFLGAWLEKAHKIANKGVHAEVNQLEATKATFHTYLVLADLLDYLHPNESRPARRDINEATLDEIESLLDVSRTIAKKIMVCRIENGRLDLALLKTVEGVGAKTLEKAKSVFSLKD